MPNFYRQKLIQSILFFAKKTRHANTTKICKLLNFFEFEHFRQTGYPSIGLKYFTFPQGPVPKELWLEIKGGNVPEDFKKYIGINIETRENETGEITEYLFKAKQKPDLSIFTPREQKILEELALTYCYATASQMSKISHEKEKPWFITKQKYGLNQPIDYKLALSQDPPILHENADNNLKEHFEMLGNFKLNPT